jgi:hypothetical protein
MIINQQTNPGVSLERTLGMPAGGPKAIPITLDFGAQTQYVLDYQNMQSRNFFDMCQTIFVDNSLSATVLSVTIPAVNQALKIPAGVQGYFTVICPNPLKMQFDSAGGVVCQVILLNFPVLG